MNIVNIDFERMPNTALRIGYEGEGKVRQVRINMDAVMSQYPDATVSLLVMPPNSKHAYPAVVSMEENTLCWNILNSDTAKDGHGHAQVVVYGAGGECLKSAIMHLFISSSLNDGGAAPDPILSWIESAEKTKKDLEDAIDKLEFAGSMGGAGQGTIKIGNGLKFDKDGALAVDAANEAEQDNTLPITSAAVYSTLGNIEVLLGTI